MTDRTFDDTEIAWLIDDEAFSRHKRESTLKLDEEQWNLLRQVRRQSLAVKRDEHEEGQPWDLAE